MDNSTKSPDKQVKVTKRTRRVFDDDMRKKENREPTKKQIDTRVQPGQVLNPNGRPKQDNPKGLKDFRLNCEKILKEAGLPMLINHMYKPDISTKDLLDIIKFLADRSYGKAKEVDYNEGNDTIKQDSISPIIISEEMMQKALKNDANHFKDEN